MAMPLVQIKIPNQLLIPFGGPKWSIERINVVGVSTTGTYIQSDTPLAHIDRSQELGLRLRHFTDVLPGEWPELAEAAEAATFIQHHLRDKCELATDYERKFIDLYFDYLKEEVAPPSYLQRHSRKDRTDWDAPFNDDNWIFDALLPLPQAHLYQSNPLDDHYSFAPSRMMKVDFVFWTGKRLVAVEIDGGSHIGSDAHVEKDRLLQRSGVHVVHILNSEIGKYGKKVVERLLPPEITKFWRHAEDKWRTNPLDGIPF
jgi:hypothetical protein